MFISISTRLFRSSTDFTLSPTCTIYWVPSASFTYPAGISKFCAVRSCDSVSILSTVLRSDLSSALFSLSSSCVFEFSSEAAAVASWADCCPIVMELIAA